MARKIKTFRLDVQTISKIESLIKIEKQSMSSDSNESDVAEREIVEAAIDYYFALKTAEPVNDPLAQKIEMIFNNTMTLYIRELAKSLESINYAVQKNSEFTQLLVKYDKQLPRDEEVKTMSTSLPVRKHLFLGKLLKHES